MQNIKNFILPDYFGVHRFTYELWRNGYFVDIGLNNRYIDIVGHKNRVRNYAIGWHSAHNLYFRSKEQRVAVMFFNKKIWWNHLTDREFIECFPELQNFLMNSRR